VLAEEEGTGAVDDDGAMCPTLCAVAVVVRVSVTSLR